MATPIWIGEHLVSKLLKRKDLIDAIEDAFGLFSKRNDGEIIQPVRSTLVGGNLKGFLGVMPAYSEKHQILSTKIVTVFPENKELPSHHAIILLFDPTNGVPRVMMDGEVITAQRTAAASAVATKYLAKQNSKILAILGAGVQARSHFEALTAIHKYDEVRVWSRTYSNVKKLCSEIEATPCTTAQDAVKDADVIVTVTSATEPVLMKEWVKEGAHINAVGACRPHWQEIDSELMRSSVVYVDSKEAAVKEAGDIIMAKAEVYAEVGEVVNGQREGKRDKTTVFKSLGMALEDLVAAKLVWDAYQKEQSDNSTSML